MCSEETKRKISERQVGKSIKHSGSFQEGHEVPQRWKDKFSGTNNINWKGNNVKYRALHAWVTRKLGRPKICEVCEITDKKRYEWANISGEYKRELSDFMRLCVPCHKAYDSGKII